MSGVWVKCPNCQHKLFCVKRNAGDVEIQVKCSSCKQIVDIIIDDEVYYTSIWNEGGP